MTLPDTLIVRLARLRRRTRRLAWTYGLGRVTAIVVCALLLAGLADWAFHFDDPGVRLALLMGVVASAGWGAWRYLAAGMSRSQSNLDTARQIEQQYPDFQDSLSSTVQFLEEGTDARLGSPELQRRVIEETVERFTEVDLSKVVDAAPARRAAGMALAICLVAALLTVAHPPSAGLALKRLLLPFSTETWPRRTNLRLVNDQFEPVEFRADEPLRTVRGRPVEYFVENADGELPQDVRLVVQVGDNAPVWETLRRATLRDSQGKTHEVCSAKIPTAEGPLRFRIIGGDDDSMPFQTMEIVPPPTIAALQITLTPPEYTGFPAEKLSSGVGHIHTLVGTRVDIAARLDIPVTEARLHLPERQPELLTLDEAGTGFRASFTVDEAGSSLYGFDFIDQFGFTHDVTRFELRGIADLVPQASIEEPPTDITVTPDAEVPVRVTAKDDLRLRDVRLWYQLGESTEAAAEIIPLEIPSGTAGPVEASYLWKLAELRLREGMRVIYHAEATDDVRYTTDDPELANAHVGRSPSRALLVISREEKANEIAARQLALMEQIEKVRTSQQQARDQVNELELQWSKAGALQPSDLDLLKRIELDQRRIFERLHEPHEGVAASAGALRDELRRNHVENAETDGRLERMVRELTDLQESHSATISQKLIEALKVAENAQSAMSNSEQERTEESKPPASETSTASQPGVASLELARKGQTSVVEALDALLDDMGRWRDRRELTADLDELIARQKALNNETAETAEKTLTKGMPDLAPQDQADLARLAERQARQAERLKNFEEELQRAVEHLDRQPADDGRFSEMQQLLKRQATSGKMQDASARLQENRIGEAMIDQQRVLENLQQADQLLKAREDLSLEARVGQIRDAERELEALHKREEELRAGAEKAASQTSTDDSASEQHKAELEQLQKEQRATREQSEETAQRLKRLQIHRAEQSLRRAGSRMQEVEQNLSQDSGEQAARSAQEALNDIEQARRETARARREAEEQLAREALEKIADALTAMIPRQQEVIDETIRLDAERTRRGNWSRGQLKSLANLADVQRGLKGETEVLADKIPDAAVFEFALRQAAAEMDRAAARLAKRMTDKGTLDAERRARKHFVDLIAALAQDQNQPSEQQTQQPAQPDQQQQQQGAPGDLIALVAQLKLLKTMQEDLRQRTTSFDELRENKEQLGEEQEQELERLAEEQGRLAEIAADMARTLLGSDAHKGESNIPEDSDNKWKKVP